MYDQKPSELPPEPVPIPPSSVMQPVSHVSRFAYLESDPDTESNATPGHVLAPPARGNFFTDFGSSASSRKPNHSDWPKSQVRKVV